MKRDLKINYGKLDDIIEELQTYEEALETMDESLGDISTLVKTNEGKSIDAWDDQLNTSKGEIRKYQAQIGDLLSLFKNYVADTTHYISPVSRKTMMRVSRNNIWANLQQMEIGVDGKIGNALNNSIKEPTPFLFGLLEDPTDAEQEASEYNKGQLEDIKGSIESTQRVVSEKMEELWDLYNKKVKPFENTDDSYKELASEAKSEYTGFFASIGEALMDPVKDSYDLLKGFIIGAFNLVKGVAIIASDAGIVLVSSQIPDPIEPAFLKDKNDEVVEDYSNAAKQVIDNPIVVAEMFTQSVSDTVEEEGAMYATGEALTAFIPVAGGLKLVKEGAVLKNVGKRKNGKDDKRSNASPSTIDGVKVIDGKVDGKVPIESYQQIRAESVHNIDGDSLMLGKYTPTIENGVENWGKAGPDSYIAKAGKESTYFDLGDNWGRIQEKYNLSNDDMFELFNVPVLDEAISAKKPIYFSHNPKGDRGFLGQELEHVVRNGYIFDEYTMTAIPTKK